MKANLADIEPMLVYDINVLIVIQYLAKYKTMQSLSQKKKKTFCPTQRQREREREREFFLLKKAQNIKCGVEMDGPGGVKSKTQD